MDFHAGDTVKLKSGGPDMTVDWIDKDSARCSWFIDNVLNKGVFQLTSLKREEE